MELKGINTKCSNKSVADALKKSGYKLLEKRVSWPRKRGPVASCPARYSQMACVVARMWSSLKLDRSEEPRWPEVPKATRCPRSAGSGRSV